MNFRLNFRDFPAWNCANVQYLWAVKHRKCPVSGISNVAFSTFNSTDLLWHWHERAKHSGHGESITIPTPRILSLSGTRAPLYSRSCSGCAGGERRKPLTLWGRSMDSSAHRLPSMIWPCCTKEPWKKNFTSENGREHPCSSGALTVPVHGPALPGSKGTGKQTGPAPREPVAEEAGAWCPQVVAASLLQGGKQMGGVLGDVFICVPS